MGGAMLLFVSLFFKKLEEFAPFGMVQIFLGILGVLAGALLLRQHKIGQYIAGVVIVGMAANMMFYLMAGVQKVKSNHRRSHVVPETVSPKD